MQISTRRLGHLAVAALFIGTLLLRWSAQVAGATITVRAGEDLQAALDRARPGDTVQLEAGATWVGAFVLPAKNGPLNRGRWNRTGVKRKRPWVTARILKLQATRRSGGAGELLGTVQPSGIRRRHGSRC